MSLVYGEDKFFIGMIKFFDSAKGFGYIASNNCGMQSARYNQDFYVNLESFLDETAKKEGCVVAFQIDKQDDGKKRAVNVRKVANTEEDFRRAMDYYGDHERVELKDKITSNLIRNIPIPRGMYMERVISNIQNDPGRTPEKTVRHIDFFIKHYRKEILPPFDLGPQRRIKTRDNTNKRPITNLFPKNQFIFDRDFVKPEKDVWESLVAILTEEETLVLLNEYPSFCKYIYNSDLINKWIESKYNNESSLTDLQGLNELLEYFPSDAKEKAIMLLEKLADNKLSSIFNTVVDNNLSERAMEREIAPYLFLTTNEHTQEKNQCLKEMRYRDFKNKMEAFVKYPYDQYRWKELMDTLDSLKEVGASYNDEIGGVMQELLGKYIADKKYTNAVDTLEHLTFLGCGFIDTYKNQILPQIKELLREKLLAEVSRSYGSETDFYIEYKRLTRLFSEEERREIKTELLPILNQISFVGVLSAYTTPAESWIQLDDALERAKNMVLSWSYQEMYEFLNKGYELFRSNKKFNDIIVDKSIDLISSYSIFEFFDGTKLEDNAKQPYSRNPERENCEFLRKISVYADTPHGKEKWGQYIQTRSAQELITLYSCRVITSLPEGVISYIIDSISLNEVIAPPVEWYYTPVIKNDKYNDILKSTRVDLFPIIADRLVKMEWSASVVPLAALLVELMCINKPSKDDYYALKEWDESFAIKLNNLKNSQPDNIRLSVILWAVYSRTKTSSSSLGEVVSELPPYLQIRCVKKLFMLISNGTIRYSAEQLHNLLTREGSRLCLPLEITFRYLEMREKNPSATLNDSDMIELLDGRVDHPQWIGIRELMTQCQSRLCVEERDFDDGSYYNGLIEDDRKGKIRVFVPNKMIDVWGNLTKYNNRWKQAVPELIRLTYKEGEYQSISNGDGEIFVFDQSYKIDLFSIARPFNFKYGRLTNQIIFTEKEYWDEDFCECRLSDKLDNYYGLSFYWCGNSPCFRAPIRFMLDSEWERYTILDFMRILNIPTDYVNKAGKRTRFGYYVILSSYLRSFKKFYEHLYCRQCGELMRPATVSNFSFRAVSEFRCENESCTEHGKTVYLNHCFNKQKCNAIIDSRDSAKCPNGQYICPDCGACCSTENFKIRIGHLKQTGGYVSDWLVDFVEKDKGHWEKGERFCWHCGSPVTRENGKCDKCGAQYGVKFVAPSPAPAPINENIQKKKEIPDEDLPF